tara:strand:+ start:259 stop:702 length:444 start_codon:yes stop_codon:yes gene_type:complete
MPTSFTNNWKNILNKLESVFSIEFKNTLRVMIGASVDAGNQYIRFDPVGSELLEYNVSSETREYSIAITYHFRDANIKTKALDHILRYVSRIESLMHDNMTMTLDKGTDADNTKAINCRMDSCTLNQGDENEYVVVWDFKCMHVGNI